MRQLGSKVINYKFKQGHQSLEKSQTFGYEKIQAEHDKFKPEHFAKHPQSLLTVLCFQHTCDGFPFLCHLNTK